MMQVSENTRAKFDTNPDHPIKIPCVPPTMIGVCRLLQIFYVLKVCIEDERKNESLHMEFPITIATVPFRTSNSQFYSVTYGNPICVDNFNEDVQISVSITLKPVNMCRPSFVLGPFMMVKTRRKPKISFFIDRCMCG